MCFLMFDRFRFLFSPTDLAKMEQTFVTLKGISRFSIAWLIYLQIQFPKQVGSICFGEDAPELILNTILMSFLLI